MKEHLHIDKAEEAAAVVLFGFLVVLFFSPKLSLSYFFNKYPAANKYFHPMGGFVKQHLKRH